MRYEGDIYRPPSEAYSYILQITIGCAHNKCTFCGSFKAKKFRIRKIEEVYEETVKLMKRHPEIEGLYISWEGPAQEAMRALADIGRQDVAISTADLDYDVAMSMARNGMIKEVSAQLPYEQGEAVALCAANALLEKEVPPYIGIEPVAVNLENLLKAWNQVYKETPPEIIVDLVKEISGEA